MIWILPWQRSGAVEKSVFMEENCVKRKFRLGLVAVVLLLLLLVILIAELLRSLFLWKKTVLKENL